MDGAKKKSDDSTPVKLSNGIIAQIDKIIKEDPDHDFKSRPDVLKYLIRKFIDHQKELESFSEKK